MPQSAPSVDGTFRVLRTIHLAMLISVFLYIWVAEKVLRHSQQSPDLVFTTSIGVLAAAVFVAAIVVRIKIVQPALDLLQTKPGDEQSLVRWRSGSISSFVLAETVMMFGVALRAVGVRLAQSAPFYLAAIVLMLFLRPRRP
jgi:hypothetical protein